MTTEHGAPWNLDQNDDGAWICSCLACKAERARQARIERKIDEYDDAGRFSRCK